MKFCRDLVCTAWNLLNKACRLHQEHQGYFQIISFPLLSIFLVNSALRSFSTKRDMRLSNNDDKVLTGKTAEQCAEACEQEASFPCRSFDFARNNGNCYLSSAGSEDAAVSAVSGFDFYQTSKLLSVSIKSTQFLSSSVFSIKKLVRIHTWVPDIVRNIIIIISSCS